MRESGPASHTRDFGGDVCRGSHSIDSLYVLGEYP